MTKLTDEVKTFFLLLAFFGFAIILIMCFCFFYLFNSLSKKCPSGKVCLSDKEYKEILVDKKTPNIIVDTQTLQINKSDTRDLRVLNDPLYPPLNRTDSQTFQRIVNESRALNVNVPTNLSDDTFHLVGYLSTNTTISQDVGGNNWKLMAREVNRNESEFYIIPTNTNYSIKIPLTPDIFVGEKIRDIYSIPTEVRFNSPLLNRTPYVFVEIPKTKFQKYY